MTIDPITIPCPFCEEIIVERSDEDFVTCEVCDIDIPVHEWVTGGINALVGKLARQGTHIEDMSYGKSPSWAWASDKGNQMGTSFKTFEACVLDAWEKLKRKKNENAY